MITHWMLFSANFLNIALRAFQQRNVNGLHYLPVIPMSLLLATTEIYVIATIALLASKDNLEWHHVLSIALGGGLGCMLSMYLHSKIFKR